MRHAVHQGAFIKHCPCSPQTVSCGYHNVNLQTGCPFSCTYCILQTYLESKEAVFFTNLADWEAGLAELANRQERLRLGTGELTDSLAWDLHSRQSEYLLPLFARYPQVIFEFKTKSTVVELLLQAPAALPNIVVSWSLNPAEVIAREEPGTPPLRERLAALAAVQEKGYRIGIHFDPLLLFPEWRERYGELIALLARVVRPERVAWWSLGALRFPPALRSHILRHSDSRLFQGELVIGYDGKYRYFKPLRVELLRFAATEIRRRISAAIPLYLCMEDEESWREVLPHLPCTEEEVNRYLYEAARRS